jgi:hypothetical protein
VRQEGCAVWGNDHFDARATDARRAQPLGGTRASPSSATAQERTAGPEPRTRRAVGAPIPDSTSRAYAQRDVAGEPPRHMSRTINQRPQPLSDVSTMKKKPHERQAVLDRRGLGAQRAAAPQTLSDRHVAVLNALRNEINHVYGFEDGWPRVNQGPCGRFAKAFRERWNARFSHKVNIVFVIEPAASDEIGCSHILVKLPDGSYFDGGNGVILGDALLRQYESEHRLEEMIDFDLALLDKRSYGLNRSYGSCPRYSDETTMLIVEKYLTLLPKD